VKKILVSSIICMIFIIFPACQTIPEPIENEPMICFEMRYVAYANKGNHDKSILSDLVRECVNQCKKQP